MNHLSDNDISDHIVVYTCIEPMHYLYSPIICLPQHVIIITTGREAPQNKLDCTLTLRHFLEQFIIITHTLTCTHTHTRTHTRTHTHVHTHTQTHTHTHTHTHRHTHTHTHTDTHTHTHTHMKSTLKEKIKICINALGFFDLVLPDFFIIIIFIIFLIHFYFGRIFFRILKN